MLNISIKYSMWTKGPMNLVAGGMIEHKCATAGGMGKVPPGTTWSPGRTFIFGLKGIIWEKSGLAMRSLESSRSRMKFGCSDEWNALVVLATSLYPMDLQPILVACLRPETRSDLLKLRRATGIQIQKLISIDQLCGLLPLEFLNPLKNGAPSLLNLNDWSEIPNVRFEF